MTSRQIPLSLTSFLLCASVVSQASAQPALTPEAADPAPASAPSSTPEPTADGSSGQAANKAPATAGIDDAQPETTVPAPAEPPTQESAKLPPPAGSGGIALFPVVATNLTEGETLALGLLFASELREEKGGRIISPDTTSKYSAGFSDQPSAASYMKAEQYLLVEAVRLDRTTIVTATLHHQDGTVIRTAKMSAKSVDDFQYVAERLVIALLEGKPVEKTQTLDNITLDEAEGKNRTFVEKVFGFKTSFVVPYSAQIDLPSMIGASFNGRLEAKNYFLEFGAGLLIPAADYNEGDPTGYGGVFAEIGGSYYLTHTNLSPYVGAGVMPRILSAQPANLAVYGQAGLMFFRTSSSRLFTELRVAQNLTPLGIWNAVYDEENDFYDTTTTRAWPIEFGVNVGLGW